MMSSHVFAKILNIFNNVAKTYSNVERIRSIIKNAIMNKLNIFENSKKRENSNVSIKNLIQILKENYDNVTFFTTNFLSQLNLIRTNRELKYKSNNFFITNRAM